MSELRLRVLLTVAAARATPHQRLWSEHGGHRGPCLAIITVGVCGVGRRDVALDSTMLNPWPPE